MPFVEYAVRGFVDGLREQLRVVRGQQYEVTWQHFVHEVFKDKDTAGDKRRRAFVLDLPPHESVPMAKVTEVSPRTATNYAKKTRKTLMRDLNELVKLGLVEIDQGSVRARRELVFAFLPARCRSN